MGELNLEVGFPQATRCLRGSKESQGRKPLVEMILEKHRIMVFFYSLLHILSFLHGTLTSSVFNNKVSSKNPQHFLKSLLYFPNQ